MASEISPWMPTQNLNAIPTCKPCAELEIDKVKFWNLVSNGDTFLELCWDCFDKRYKCYSLKPEYHVAIHSHNFNQSNFQFSFRELDNLPQTNNIFEFKRRHMLSGLNINTKSYISDVFGLALLWWNGLKLRIHYCDLKKTFSCYIEIPFDSHGIREIKLKSTTIWIIGKDFTVDVIYIENENEWYHIVPKSIITTQLARVESNTIIIGNDDCHQSLNHFSSCKVLCVDTKYLLPNQTYRKQFVKFFKPKELEKKYLSVIGIFKRTLVLIHLFNSSVCYFLSYSDNMVLQSSNKIDLSIAFSDNFLLEHFFLPQRKNIFLATSINTFTRDINLVVVVDARTFRIRQVLKFTSSKRFDKFYFHWSKKIREINMICENDTDRFFILKYPIIYGHSLRELSIKTIVNTFSTEAIQATNLPNYLLRDILLRKVS